MYITSPPAGTLPVHTLMNKRQLERTEASGLRRDAISLSVCHWYRGRRRRPLSQHEPRASQDWCVVFFLLMRHFPRLAFLIVLLQHFDRTCLLAEEVDHVGHSEIMKTVTPGHLQDDIGADEIVAGIQHADVALPAANIDKLDTVSKIVPV